MNSIHNSFRSLDPDLRGISQEQIQLRQPQVGKVSSDSSGSGQSQGAPGVGFLETLEKAMSEVNQDQLAADQAIKNVVAGKSKNIHETMLMIQKAELSLKTMMQVRNKILEAYKEIIRMQV